MIKGKFVLLKHCRLKDLLGSIKRSGSRIFVTFRPQEEVSDEISVTSGHDYKTSSVVAKSGKKEFTFFTENFAWLLDEREEKNFIKVNEKSYKLNYNCKSS